VQIAELDRSFFFFPRKHCAEVDELNVGKKSALLTTHHGFCIALAWAPPLPIPLPHELPWHAALAMQSLSLGRALAKLETRLKGSRALSYQQDKVPNLQQHQATSKYINPTFCLLINLDFSLSLTCLEVPIKLAL
jgi:hypothetical protein